jgi:hypothetical protein
MKIKILKSGCAYDGVRYGEKTTVDLDIEKLPPQWEGKAVIVTDDKKEKVKKNG